MKKKTNTMLKKIEEIIKQILIEFIIVEKWPVFQWHAKKMNHSHTTRFRKILSTKWQEKFLPQNYSFICRGWVMQFAYQLTGFQRNFGVWQMLLGKRKYMPQR